MTKAKDNAINCAWKLSDSGYESCNNLHIIESKTTSQLSDGAYIVGGHHEQL